MQGCRKRGGGGGAIAPLQSLSTLCERPAPKIVHLPTTFWVQAYAATCMCKQTAAPQPHVPASLCVFQHDKEVLTSG